MISFSVILCVFFSAFFVVEGTLTPDGTVPLDCSSQQNFTCSVTGPSAVWTISGLSGISVTSTPGQTAANNNARITSTDTSGLTQSSTITITGFTTSDNGGTIQCINLENGSVQGMANISVGIPQCDEVILNNTLNDECTDATVDWKRSSNSPLVTSTTVTYCLTSSENCENMNCTTSPCNISGLTPTEDHNFTVIPNNNCGSATGCTGNIPPRGTPSCPMNIRTVWNDDLSSANITWQQPPNTPPVTFTTVTYCPTSSPNSITSMNCTTGLSYCTISVSNCSVGYNLTLVPNNNCGGPSTCTENKDYLRDGTPTLTNFNVKVDNALATVSWQQPPNTPPVTSTTVTYCPTSSPNCGNSVNCTSPCTIGGLDSGTKYQFTAMPMNTCGMGSSVIFTQVDDDHTNVIVGSVVGVVVAVILLSTLITVPIVIYCCCCKPANHVVQKPMESPLTGGESVDSPKEKDIEKRKEEKLTYAALEFTEQAGSTGEKKVRSKEEPVQYAAVEQA